MKRVALISVHGDPSADIGAEGAGGQNVYVREVARAVASCGVAVDVFTRSQVPGGIRTSALAPGARSLQVPFGPAGYVQRDSLFKLLPDFVRKVAEWVRREGLDYDAIHSNYWLSGWAGMRLSSFWKTPQTHTFHSLGKVKYEAMGSVVPEPGRIRLGVEEAIGSSVAALVATTKDEARKLRRLYRATSRIEVIPCGYDPEVFRPLHRGRCRERLGLPQDAPILLYVGRFVREKGIETLVRAASVLRLEHPVHLVMVGGYQPGGADEPEYRRIRSLVTDLGLGPVTHFAGAVGHDDLAAYYCAADVTVVPSHYEAFGMVAIEAMASGCPVVASDAGGLASNVVHGETGLLARPEDVAGFTLCISALLADRYLARKLVILALRRTRGNFSWPTVAEHLQRHYVSLSTAGSALG